MRKPKFTSTAARRPRQRMVAPLLVIYALYIAPLTDLVDTPYVENEAVEQGQGGQNGKHPR